jgi:hypothetical protein
VWLSEAATFRESKKRGGSLNFQGACLGALPNARSVFRYIGIGAYSSCTQFSRIFSGKAIHLVCTDM